MTIRVAVVTVYFLMFGAYGTLLPFLPVILHTQGLNDAELSVALSATGFAALLSPILIAHFADALLPIKRLLFGIFVLAAMLSPLWLQVSSVWSAFVVTLLVFSLLIPAISSLDTFTVDYLRTTQEESGHAPFTFQGARVWGSIGFMVPTLIFLIISLERGASIPLLIGAVVFCCILAALSSFLLPDNQPVRDGGKKPSRRALALVAKEPLRSIFLATSIAGVSLSIFFAVFPRYLQELGANTTEVGLIINLGVLWEVLLIPFTAWFIARIGPYNLIVVGIVAIPLRLLTLAFFPSLAMAVALQMLHAPVVVGLMVSMPILLNQLGGAQFRYSLQSLYTMAAMGIARVIGPLAVAPVLEKFRDQPLLGIRWAFVFAGVLALSGVVVLKQGLRGRSPATSTP